MDQQIKKTPLEIAKERLTLGVIGSLTLGLAPFSPPHIFGKLKWVLGGAHGMQAMDWFDFIMHGSPWVYLVYGLVSYLKVKKAN